MAAASTTSPLDSATTPALRLVGRPFLGAWLDFLLIGGGLSLPVIALVLAGPRAPWVGGITAQLLRLTGPEILPWTFFVISGTHFAASTVRLYTKPGAPQRLPFLTMGFPLVVFAVLAFSIAYPEAIGRLLRSIYFTWSPYHYAAQAYGLACMYSYRSGSGLSAAEKRGLRWVSLMPFLYAFVTTSGAGLHWILPDSLYARPEATAILQPLSWLLIAAGMLGPVVLFVKSLSRPGPALPLIVPLLLLVNGFWWFVLPASRAFVWATFFHGIQYLTIVLVFHARDQQAVPGSRHAGWVHALRFYGWCLAVAYALFNCVPYAFALAGFGLTQSLLLTAAAINVHHFIVDGFIWRLGRQDGNRKIVEAGGRDLPGGQPTFTAA